MGYKNMGTKMGMKSLPPLLFGSLLLAGCTVGPDYTPPATPMPSAWISTVPNQQTGQQMVAPPVLTPPAAGPMGAAAPAPVAVATKAPVPVTAPVVKANAAPAMLSPPVNVAEAVPATAVQTNIDPVVVEQDWWQHFHDPVLNQLIERALANNYDLKIAQTKIEEARAMRSYAVSSLYPTGDVKGSGEREANQYAFPGNFPGLKEPFNVYNTGFDASWELDLFGGVRRQIEASTSEMQAAEADRDAARVSLLAEVARTYIDIRQYQAQIVIAKDIIVSEQNTVAIAKQRFNAGDTAHIDVNQSQAQAEQTAAQLPVYESQLRQSEFSLDVLLGETPGTTLALVDKPGALPAPSESLVLDAPASVIANRPDIRAAERRLQEATAQQGVATAKFYPDISLSGFFGLLNTDANHLLTGASKSWMFTGSVLWSILDYGHISANLDNANAEQKEALENYQKTVITALADVERAVTAYNKQNEYCRNLAQVVDENERVNRISRERYRQGLTAFVDVLVAEQSLYNARSALETAQAQSVQDLVAIYKSLGRGWQVGPGQQQAAN